MIPTYILTGETFELKGRGTVYVARTACMCTIDDIHELVGREIEGIKGKITAIERFAIHDQSYKLIGLLVNHG